MRKRLYSVSVFFSRKGFYNLPSILTCGVKNVNQGHAIECNMSFVWYLIATFRKFYLLNISKVKTFFVKSKHISLELQMVWVTCKFYAIPFQNDKHHCDSYLFYLKKRKNYVFSASTIYFEVFKIGTLDHYSRKSLNVICNC